VRTEVPDLDRVAETRVANLLREPPALQPMFVTDVQRTIRTVRCSNALIYVALDGGRIDAGDATQSISELELELKDGDPEPIYRLAAALHAVVPMILCAESKADRGRRLRTGRPRDPVKQVDIDLADDVTAAEGFRRIIAGALGCSPSAALAWVTLCRLTSVLFRGRVADRRFSGLRPHCQ
jgi:triphosphatase